MKDPTRRQIMMMADEAGITDYEAAARLVRLALAAFRPAPVLAKEAGELVSLFRGWAEAYPDGAKLDPQWLTRAADLLERQAASAPAGEVMEVAHVRRMCEIILGNTFGNEELDSLALLVGHHPDVLNASTAPAAERPRWSEGVCGDGAAILRDGVMVPIEEVIAELNRRSAPAPEQLAQIIYERAMVAAAGPQGRFWPSWAELPESDARAHAMAAAGAILAAWGRPGPEPAGRSSQDQADWRGLCRELLAVFERYDGESNLDGILLDLAASGNDCIGRACEFFGVPRLLPHRTPEKLPQEG